MDCRIVLLSIFLAVLVTADRCRNKEQEKCHDVMERKGITHLCERSWAKRDCKSLCRICTVSVLKMTADPSEVRPNITPYLYLRCQLKERSVYGQVGSDPLTYSAGFEPPTAPADSEPPTADASPSKSDDIKAVTSLRITKRGYGPIATITISTEAVVNDNLNNVTVSGDITGATGHLCVTWADPTEDVVGTYKCEAAVVNSQDEVESLKHPVIVNLAEISIGDVIEQLNQLNDRNDQLVNMIEQLRIDHDLNTEDDLKRENEQLTKTDQLRVDLDLNTEDDRNRENTIKDLADTTDGMNQTLTSLQLRVNHKVYFSAALTSQQTLSNNDIVKYDYVFTNNGGGYDPATGQFTCPETGVYQFLMHVVTPLDKKALLYLYHDGNWVITMFADDDLDLQSASNSVVIDVNKGDIVQVKSSGTSYLNGGSFRYITFSGNLLFTK